LILGNSFLQRCRFTELILHDDLTVAWHHGLDIA
jgi:hypothetical protein